MKQTAVEWLFEQLEKQGESWENVSIGRIQISIKVEDYLKLKEQAKEMEKEQIIKFAEFLCTYPDKNRNVYGEILHAKSKYDSSYRTKEIFKEFINNHYGK
jgi:hypothetical protein